MIVILIYYNIYIILYYVNITFILYNKSYYNIIIWKQII